MSATKADLIGDHRRAAKFLINAGACQLAVFRYQDAFTTMERAREVAEQTGEMDVIATANANIASLYLQMSNFISAEAAGQRALSALRENHPQYARVMIPLAQVAAERHELARAEPLIQRAIDASYRSGDTDTAAWAWDYLGYRYTLEHRLAEADRALTESLRLRTLFHLPDLGDSYFHLATLRSEQGNDRAALALMDSAVRELQTPGNVTPAWNIFYERGRLLSKSGDWKGAWVNLGKAVELARDWRAEVIENDANRTSAERGLSDLYSLYIDVGNHYASSQGISLASETFEAAEENRATSLRALTERETGWHNRLPARYWETLSSLQEAERAMLQRDSPETRADVVRFRGMLDAMEAATGVPQVLTVKSAATATQEKLGPESVLLSFQLGDPRSWLWAVTNHSVKVFSLPPRSVLSPQIQEFQECVRRGAPCAEQKGASLFRSLFGGLPLEFAGRERWLFSLDQELFSLPIAALVLRFEGGKPVYLGAVHALQAVPGALLYTSSSRRPNFAGPLLGVGDAIYNSADPRWQLRVSQAGIGFVPPNYREPRHLFPFARLWGAADEVRAVAATWGQRGSVVLTGRMVNRDRLWAGLDAHPAIVHFATHILEADNQLHTGWIALSIAPSGQPEFVSPAEISARRVDTSLIVLNGCSSGKGEIHAASGLMGLTRAWIAAGATDVLATRWPGPDEEGGFFVEFYEKLKQFPEKGPSYALLAACQKSIREGGWRARPQFWASYFLTGTD